MKQIIFKTGLTFLLSMGMIDNLAHAGCCHSKDNLGDDSDGRIPAKPATMNSPLLSHAAREGARADAEEAERLRALEVARLAAKAEEAERTRREEAASLAKAEAEEAEARARSEAKSTIPSPVTRESSNSDVVAARSSRAPSVGASSVTGSVFSFGAAHGASQAIGVGIGLSFHAESGIHGLEDLTLTEKKGFKFYPFAQHFKDNMDKTAAFLGRLGQKNSGKYITPECLKLCHSMMAEVIQILNNANYVMSYSYKSTPAYQKFFVRLKAGAFSPVKSALYNLFAGFREIPEDSQAAGMVRVFEDSLDQFDSSMPDPNYLNLVVGMITQDEKVV